MLKVKLNYQVWRMQAGKGVHACQGRTRVQRFGSGALRAPAGGTWGGGLE